MLKKPNSFQPFMLVSLFYTFDIVFIVIFFVSGSQILRLVFSEMSSLHDYE